PLQPQRQHAQGRRVSLSRRAPGRSALRLLRSGQPAFQCPGVPEAFARRRRTSSPGAVSAISLSLSLSAAKGWSAPELEPVYARARELGAQIRDPVLAFRVLYGQWAIRWWKLELHDALELADELLASAEKVKDPKMLLAGNLARGTTLIY